MVYTEPGWSRGMNFSYHLLRMSAVFVLALIFPAGLSAVVEGEVTLELK